MRLKNLYASFEDEVVSLEAPLGASYFVRNNGVSSVVEKIYRERGMTSLFRSVGWFRE